MKRRWVARGLWGFAEAAVTFGLVVLLFVAHQLWWTNMRARDGAQRQVEELEREWGDVRAPSAGDAGNGEEPSVPGTEDEAEAGGGGPGGRDGGGGGRRAAKPRYDRAYAVLRIPAIGVTVPVAEGVSKSRVLNYGYVGHYPRTAQPGRAGNFAVAGHRNTHGEPFRQLDEVGPGDRVVVDTREARYTYTVDRTLARTSASDGTVIAPVPHSSVHPGHGFTEPGTYITLTTCTPEFTSRYRLVVWGHLTSALPR